MTGAPPARRSAPASGLDGSGLVEAIRQDIAAPVDGMVAMAELLQRHPLSTDGAACLRALLEQGRRLQSLLADLTETTPAKPQTEVVSPAEMLDDLAADWRRRAAPRPERVVVVSRCPPDLLVRADAVRLRRVLDALATEILCGDDTGGLELQMVGEAVGEQVRLDIALCGSGSAGGGAIPGFTLALAMKALRSMGGRLDTVANAGRGVTRRLSLSLPLERPLRQDQAAGVQAIHSTLGHVLVVDDNATNRAVAEALCSALGFSCETAEDGSAALDAVALRDFDLILMDVRMPRMDGIEATRRIRALPGAAGLTVIVALTADADPESVRACEAAGMDDVIEKPIKPERLEAALQAALSRGAERRTRPAQREFEVRRPRTG